MADGGGRLYYIKSVVLFIHSASLVFTQTGDAKRRTHLSLWAGEHKMIFMALQWVCGWLTPHPFWISDLGKKGEFLVRRHFRRRGYHVAEKNWRHGRGEIDAIMANPKGFVFVEVKTRTWRRDLFMADQLSQDQEKRLKRLAGRYLSQWNTAYPWRFDLFLVTRKGSKWRLQSMRI